jgi:tRNA 2-thiouridine synthesizing protein E
MMSNTLKLAPKNIEVDQQGFLKKLSDWNKKVAEILALNEGIQLHSGHWEIITLTRQYYNEFECSPANRALIKYVQRELGSEKGRSIYLMSLFSESPAKLASKIGGLPKPDNCF